MSALVRFLGAVTAALMTMAIPMSAVAACPNEALREQQKSSFLPGCRGYEMVSPPDKNGADLNFDFDTVIAAPSGDRASFQSGGAFAGTRGTTGLARYVASRGSGGWTTAGISPPYAPASGFSILSGAGLVVGFSQDLSRSIFQLDSPSLDPGAQNGVVNLYSQNGADSDYRRITTEPIPNPGPFSGYVPYIADATDDFGHVLFESSQALLPEAPEMTQLYESVDGKVRLVGRLPDESVPNEVVVAGSGASVTPNAQTNGAGADTGNTISEDGSRIFFTVVPNFVPSSPNEGQVYVRIGGTTTRHASASQRTDCAEADPCSGDPAPDPAGPHPALFRGATPDGSAVFFTSSEQLVDEDSNGGADLYRFDVDDESLHLLSPDLEPADGSGANVLGSLGFSTDGAIAYFVAEGQLVAGETPAPGPKLYVNTGSQLRYLAALDPADQDTWQAIQNGVRKDSRVTPSGSNAFFLSRSTLMGSDNAGRAAAYAYDLDEDRIVCVSCRPDGEPSTSDALLNAASGGATAAPYRHPMLRPISDDGRFVAFMTTEALLSRDSNGVMDVYLYDTDEGRLSLVSSGRSGADSYLGTLTPDGGDVFFLTRERLVGIDRDTNLDLYDARVGGGFAAQAGPPAPFECVGEACRPKSPPPAPPPAPASNAVHLPKKHKSVKKRKKHRKKKQQRRGGREKKQQGTQKHKVRSGRQGGR